MEKVKERIRQYIKNGTIKTEGIRKLKREFKLSEKDLCDMWLVERHKLDPSSKMGKMSIISDYTWLKVRVKRKDVDLIKDYIKSLDI